MNVYCKIENQEDYDYFFQYDPDYSIYYPCFFNIYTTRLDVTDRGMRTLPKSWNPNKENAEGVTVEEMKQLAFIRSLEL